MTREQQETVFCQICKGKKKLNEVIPAELIHEPIIGTIRKTHPDWSPSGFICISDLNQFRTKYVKDVLETGKGELSTLEEQAVRSLKENELLSKNINIGFDKKLTFGERLADRIADFGGSWSFVVIFSVSSFYGLPQTPSFLFGDRSTHIHSSFSTSSFRALLLYKLPLL
jgi:hypothetical protein